MKKLLFPVLIFCLACEAKAATDITTPTVSGTWTTSGSPYRVFNDIVLSAGSTLTIEPGVSVVFQGSFHFSVLGSLYALGTPSSPVSFSAQDTTGWHSSTDYSGGWRGITFGSEFNVYPDSCVVQNSNFRDMKGSGLSIYNKKFALTDCKLFHNYSYGPGTLFTLNVNNNLGLPREFTMTGTELYDNTGIALFSVFNVKAEIRDNSFHNNSCERIIGLTGFPCVFSNNEVAHNSATRDIVAGFDNVTISGCRIYENVSENLAAVFMNGSGTVSGNLICNNHQTSPSCALTDGGGGIHLSSNSGSIDPNRFNFVVTNNIIANNYSPYQGGGIKIEQVLGAMTLTITNNHIVHNSSPSGSAIYIHSTSSKTTIKNNIIIGDQVPAPGYSPIRGFTGTSPFHFENNLAEVPAWWIYGLLTGSNFTGDTTTHITASDAGMIDATSTSSYTEMAIAKNFALTPVSPCINAGDTAGAKCLTTDYAGNTRLHGLKVDIGAYEYAPATGITHAATPTSGMNVFPNPAHDEIVISTPSATGTILLSDMTGRILVQANASTASTRLSVHEIPSGVYFITWHSHWDDQTQKVIIE